MNPIMDRSMIRVKSLREQQQQENDNPISGIIKFGVGIFMLVIVAGLIYGGLGTVFDAINDAGDSAISDTDYRSDSNTIISSLPQIFGTILVIFAIGGVVWITALLNKRERERFRYEE